MSSVFPPTSKQLQKERETSDTTFNSVVGHLALPFQTENEDNELIMNAVTSVASSENIYD